MLDTIRALLDPGWTIDDHGLITAEKDGIRRLVYIFHINAPPARFSDLAREGWVEFEKGQFDLLSGATKEEFAVKKIMERVRAMKEEKL